MSRTNTFSIKKNDTSPSLIYQLTLGDGQTISGATVRFHMADADGSVIVDAAAAIHSESLAQLRYDWVAPNTATSGAYRAEFEVTFGSGAIETFPNTGYITVKIIDDLA